MNIYREKKYNVHWPLLHFLVLELFLCSSVHFFFCGIARYTSPPSFFVTLIFTVNPLDFICFAADPFVLVRCCCFCFLVILVIQKRWGAVQWTATTFHLTIKQSCANTTPNCDETRQRVLFLCATLLLYISLFIYIIVLFINQLLLSITVVVYYYYNQSLLSITVVIIII